MRLKPAVDFRFPIIRLGGCLFQGDFVKLVSSVAKLLRVDGHAGNSNMTEAERQATYLEAYKGHGIYGAHDWGDPETCGELRDILWEWIRPNLGAEQAVLEIGAGGGRWSRYLRPAATVYLVDASPRSESLIRECLRESDRFTFLISRDGSLGMIPTDSVDYVFSFDTFVHFHQELFDAYLQEIARVLKPGGVLHLHHAARIGTEDNPVCFLYREPLELAETVQGLGFEGPLRRLHRPSGYGSILVEFRRQ